MKKIIVIAVLLCSGLYTVTAQTTRLMSYNLRLDVKSDGENQWSLRKDKLVGLLKFYSPDFVGVQEALPHQMHYIDSSLVTYGYIGKGRDDGKEQGEFSAIFYNKDKFKLLDNATFWLSEHPDQVSMGWDAAYKRVCTYGLFQDKATNKKFYVFNTHFDHVGDVARIKSAQLIIEKIKAINTQNLPFFLSGDFNLESDSAPIQYIASQLNDSKAVAELVYGPAGTFNNFEFTKPVTMRIDYIFTSKKGITVKKYAVLSNSDQCKYPSDHFPVLIDVEWNKK
ncbi:endonuclease/exonuclease/phosphatase family protein [Flavobacterium kingsejongi]|uniref:Endonuclease/exonuclease/phosphatase n=1 Tax=Flavobacterium kingsejongi TaxID=1678728 RepID=A0A2S1LU27_9FLAO|nr:endonuclease/exonuclease/phosphatase family protein [Flavobacterium kingsejongi]AWG27136.1 endonuclease/exonuclease/phosphatase [Flavobacterium kingsejongi]